ncbi:MAG: P-loop NTPase, partial [Nitrospirota bacterium]|nr:P-loop NTPase [Nitrospirota bacterium]
VFRKGGGEASAADMDVPFLGRVPLDPEMVLQCDRGEPYTLFHSDLPTADALHGIANKIEEFCKKKGSLVNVKGRPAPFKQP